MADRPGTICITAILKGEDRFLDEWIAYHRVIGVEHFFLYDNHPAQTLAKLLAPHKKYVTVMPWLSYDLLPGRDKLTKAYTDFVQRFGAFFRWVAFIDADEFIVLKKHRTMRAFLADYEKYGAVSLHWQLFGHNGHFEEPEDLVIASLLRRQREPSRMFKTISKVEMIRGIESSHYCDLITRSRVDAHGRPFVDKMYRGKNDIAHINHYFCRSFLNWMGRVDRGMVSEIDKTHKDHAWRFDELACLKKFVRDCAECNELEDDYMLKYVPRVRKFLAGISR